MREKENLLLSSAWGSCRDKCCHPEIKRELGDSKVKQDTRKDARKWQEGTVGTTLGGRAGGHTQRRLTDVYFFK